MGDEYNITAIKSSLEATPTFSTMTHIKAKYTDKGINTNAGDKNSTSQMLSSSGNPIALKELTATMAQAKAIVAADSTWASITLTVS